DTGGAPLSVSAVIAADGSELAVGQFHVFEFGSLRVNADGTFTLDPRDTDLALNLNDGDLAEFGFGYRLSDGSNAALGTVSVTIEGRDDVTAPRNEIIGTNGKNFLVGTDGDDLIQGLGGLDILVGKG